METEALISYSKLKSISILGCGWLGKSVAVELIKAGYSVSGSTTQPSKLAELRTVGIKPFLLKFDPQISGSDYQDFFQSDILLISIPPKRKLGLSNMFREQLKQVIQEVLMGSISNVLFISSTSVYSNCNSIVKEEAEDATSDLVTAENLFFAESKFKTTVLRFGGLVGDDRHPGRFLSIKKELAGGNNLINIIHQRDCIEIIKLIIQQDVWNEIFNACADLHPTRKEFYTKASTILKLEPPDFLDSEDKNFKVVSSEKLKQKLKYSFIFPDPMEMLERWS